MTFQVEVGRFFDESDHTAESMRFYPGEIDVVPGDTLHFTTESFHGVTLIPVGTTPEQWTADFGAPGQSWSPFSADEDDGSGAMKVNPNVASPTDACGWPTQGPCEFDGTGDPGANALNSGLALFPGPNGNTAELSFNVTITADPGVTFYAVDPLHPAMSMKINVVPTFEERSDAAALASAAESQFAADRRQATRLHNTYKKKKVKSTKKGVTTWKAWAGVETPSISLRRMYPSKLTIKKGDKVKWAFTLNRFEAHTVTFPRSKAIRQAGAFPEIVCDALGDEDTEPDTAPTSTSAPFCGSLADVELDVPSAMTVPAGDRKLKTKKDYESSGPRGASFAPTKAAYTLSFPKKSSKAGFPYACSIHEAAHAPMPGKVVVK